MSRLSRMLGGVFQGAAIIGALGLIAIAIMISVDVFVRWLTGRPLVGVFEFSGVLLVLVTFMPLAMVLFGNHQLRVDIVQEYVRGRPAAALGLVDAGIGLLVFGLLLWIGTQEFFTAYRGRFLLRGMIEIPTWIPIAMICLGTLLALAALAFQAADHVLKLAGRRPADPPETTTDGGL